ncbi:MAG: four helix bundle protein [Bacteroidetes bacterium]|nr:four helix bundle protein [Bacteroidota bacterium]
MAKDISEIELKIIQMIFHRVKAWRKRKYPKSFISKLSDSDAEGAETQVWLDYSLACKYINENTHNILNEKYEHILGMLVNMMRNPEKWTVNYK